MNVFLGIFGLLSCYTIACLAFAVLFQKARFPFENPVANLICALPLGPIAIAWFLWICFHLIPKQPYAFYVVLTLVPFVMACIIWHKPALHIIARTLAALSRIGRATPKNSLGGIDKTPIFIWLGGFILLFATSIQLFGMPMMASDPLEYAALSEVIYLDRSMENYPLDPSNEQGFYARSSHPPAYHMMIVYSYIWQGAAGSSRFLRFIELHYFFSFALLMVLACLKATEKGERRNMATALGLLFLFCVPFYTSLVAAFHIDPVRIPLFMLGFIFIAQLLRREERWVSLKGVKGRVMGLKDGFLFSAPIFITGIGIGLGMFAHSIGILLLPFAQGAYFLTTKSSFWRRCAMCTVFGLVALLIGCGQFVLNTIEFGVPLHDTEPVWELPQVDHKTDVRFRRNLVTLQQRIQNGFAVWFFAPTLYGRVHFFAILALIFAWPRIWGNIMARVMFLGMIQFYVLAALTMSLGVDMVIKNIRYMLTIMPFVVLLAAVGGGELYARVVEYTQNRKS